MFRAVLAMMFLTAAADAQPPRSVEVWGNVGAARVAGDEGWHGGGAMYGGGVSVPLTRRIAVEADVSRVSVDRFGPSTHTFVSPAVVWRWGTDRVYGFVGTGLGIVANRTTGYEPDFLTGQSPAYVTRRFTEYNTTLHGRGGFLVAPGERWIIRTELFSGWQYALPTFALKIGLGYRFP